MFRFTIEGGGKWTLSVEPDGRDGLAGGANGKDWDCVFTESSPGARPYTVNLTPANSAWALSVFNPGGVSESSEIVVGLKPFDRSTGQVSAWPNREGRVTTCPVDVLTKLGGDEAPYCDDAYHLKFRKPSEQQNVPSGGPRP
jgi:hypothetical protein